jgi:GH35 family endo-1,4-beta-xylanase
VKYQLVVLTIATLAASAAEIQADDVLAEAAKGIEQYRKGEVTIAVHDANGAPVAGAEVMVRQVSHDFLFGNYIRPRHYTNQRYLKRFKELFNFIQLLEFNWGQYEPDEGKSLVKERMDFIREWGISNGFEKYYGHMLVWTRQYNEYPRTGLPLWLFQYDKPRQYELLRQRIEREVSTYKDIDIFWDVVNEASHCRVWGDWDKDNYVQNRQAEPFDRVLTYVADALTWAHQANRNALLLINDYSVIAKSPYQRRFKQLIEALQADKVDLHAVGIQAHEPFKGKYWYSPAELWEAYDMFGTETGLPIYITEYFQVSEPSQAIRGVYRSGKWSKENQADAIEQFYRVSFGHPSVEAIIYFGLVDSDVVQPYCGLLDEDYNPKPAWNRLKGLIWDEWTTEMSGKTNADGTFKFRGFYGQYNLKTQTGGKTTTSDIHVDKGAANRFSIRV